MRNAENRFNRRDAAIFAIAGITLLVTWGFFDRLPNPVPTHWNLHGEADGFTALPWGAVIFPAIIMVGWVLMKVLPLISPKAFGMRRFQGAFEVVMVAGAGLLALTQLSILFDLEHLVPYALGLYVAVLGNYLGKTEPNFFFGIRTPWTLADAQVWRRTHRLGGWVFVLCGLLIIACTPFGYGFAALAVLLVSAALYLVGYSYVIYVRLNRSAPSSPSR